MDGKLGKKYLKNYFAKTDPLFQKYLRSKVSESRKQGYITGEVIRKFSEVARLGKKIRGSLVTIGYQLSGGKLDKNIFDTSLFVELFHAGVLVHDDIQDRAGYRRGVVSVHEHFKKVGKSLGVLIDTNHYGLSMALDAGISAYYYSWEKLLSSNFTAESKVRAGKIYADFIQRVSDGQTLDITGMSIRKIKEVDVLKVLRLKTAEYTGVMPLLIGAVLAGETSKKRLLNLEKYGLAFGWAFQIQDDYLGIFGDEVEVGKPVGSDISEGKLTLFMLHLMKTGSNEQVKFMRKVLGNPNIGDREVKRMRKILIDAGTRDYVLKKGWKYVDEGKKYIPLITKDKKMQELLESLIVYMMERTL